MSNSKEGFSCLVSLYSLLVKSQTECSSMVLQPLWKPMWINLRNIKLNLLRDLAIALLGVCSQEVGVYILE